MSLLIIVLLVLLVAGGGWGYHSGYSGSPYFGGGIGLILAVILVLFLLGRI